MATYEAVSAEFQAEWRNFQAPALQRLLPVEIIEVFCRELKHTWRRRILFPAAMIWSMVYRALHPDKSIRCAVADLAARAEGRAAAGGGTPAEPSRFRKRREKKSRWAQAAKKRKGTRQRGNLIRSAAADEKVSGPTESAWCQARSRLPLELCHRLIRWLADRARELLQGKALWRGRRIYLLDGSTVSMPDTPELAEEFDRTKGYHGNSKFPVARIVALMDGFTRLIETYRVAACRVSEQALFCEILSSLSRGAVVIADASFSGFPTFAACRQAGVGLITRMNERRDLKRMRREGKRLGPNDWLVRIALNPATQRAHPESADWPETIAIRLLRCDYRNARGKVVTIWLGTTLLDPERYPWEEIAELYRQRWGIETAYNHLKTTLEMNVLRGVQPGTVRREIAATLLAHNLTLCLMHEAAGHTGKPFDRMSFAATVKLVLAFSSQIAAAQTVEAFEELYQALLRQIAKRLNPDRPGRHEPRLIKRDRHRYEFLRTSRQEARKRLV